MAIKHAFTSPKSDGPDATRVRPSNWNADHVGTVPAADVPIADAGNRFTGTEAEAALQELAGAGRTTETVKANADAIATKVPTSRQIIAGTGLSGGGDLTVDRTLSLSAGWYKIADPPTGWLASKTSGWTADRFTSATGGFEVDFSSVVPAGAKAIRVAVYFYNGVSDGHAMFARKAGDANISNTPNASSEYSHYIDYHYSVRDTVRQIVLWLSSDGKVEIAVTSIDTDAYVAYPLEYLI